MDEPVKNIDEIIDRILDDLASGLVDASDDEILNAISQYNLDTEDELDLLDEIDLIRKGSEVAAKGSFANYEQEAKKMANEDNTEVEINKDDKDDDGDVDTITVTKKEPEDDKSKDDSFNNDEKSHDEELADEGNKTNSIARNIASLRIGS